MTENSSSQRFFVVITELGQPTQVSWPKYLAEVRADFSLFVDRPLANIDAEFELDNSDEFHWDEPSNDTGFHVLPAGPAPE